MLSNPAGSSRNSALASETHRSYACQASLWLRVPGPITIWVVRSRSSPSCVIRQKQRTSAGSSELYHCQAFAKCSWSGELSANQTFTSGKTDDVVDLLIVNSDGPWRIRLEDRLRKPLHRLSGTFVDLPMNTAQDQLTNGSALTNGLHLQAAVSLIRNVNGGSH